MAEFTFDLKIACQTTVAGKDAFDAESMLPDIVESINALLSQASSVHKSLMHISFEIDDCDGPILLDEDDDVS